LCKQDKAKAARCQRLFKDQWKLAPIGHPWRKYNGIICISRSSLERVVAFRTSTLQEFGYNDDGKENLWVCRHHLPPELLEMYERHFMPKPLTKERAIQIDAQLAKMGFPLSHFSTPENSFYNILTAVWPDARKNPNWRNRFVPRAISNLDFTEWHHNEWLGRANAQILPRTVPELPIATGPTEMAAKQLPVFDSAEFASVDLLLAGSTVEPVSVAFEAESRAVAWDEHTPSEADNCAHKRKRLAETLDPMGATGQLPAELPDNGASNAQRLVATSEVVGTFYLAAGMSAAANDDDTS
jgi:hypothetical protein